jgi:hypothetical protein
MRFTDGHTTSKIRVYFTHLTQLNHVNQPKHEALYKTQNQYTCDWGPVN